MFSNSRTGPVTLNREYLPHLAAHARLVLELGYSADRAVFSQYRTFGSDIRTERAGQRYELDSLFLDSTKRPYLHIEVKKNPAHVAVLARDIRPNYFRLVAPGSMDPERYVWRVEVETMDAVFEPCGMLPKAA